MQSSFFRSRSMAIQLLLVIGCLVLPAPVAVTLAATVLADQPVYTAAACIIAAGAIAFRLVGQTKWMGAALAFAAVATCIIAAVTPVVALKTRGEHVTATVTHRSVKPCLNCRVPQSKYHYALIEPDGTAIPRDLRLWDDALVVGDQIDVVFDPAGWIRPMTANELDRYHSGGWLAVAWVLLLIAVALCAPALTSPQPQRSRRSPGGSRFHTQDQ